MKKIITLLLLTLLAVNVQAQAHDNIQLSTIDEARVYCPSETSLSFKINNPAIPNSAGTIIGTNQKDFVSQPINMIQPKNLTNGIIMDASFRSANGIYGYIVNNVVTCLYWYRGFPGNQVALSMRSI